MATIDVSERNTPIHGGTFGNASVAHFPYTPAANLTIGDEVRLCVLEAGTKLIDAQAFIAANLASGALSLGYRYADAALSAQDDPAYFLSAQSIATAGRFRAATNKPPVTLVARAFLVATFAGAAFPTTNKLDTVVNYDFRGNP